MRLPTRTLVAAATAAVLLAACSSGPPSRAVSRPTPTSSSAAGSTASAPVLNGMPPALDATDVYAADRPNQLSPEVKGFRSLVYVPNSLSNTVDVIDPTTLEVVDHFPVGRLPQHVVPSWDLKTL